MFNDPKVASNTHLIAALKYADPALIKAALIKQIETHGLTVNQRRLLDNILDDALRFRLLDDALRKMETAAAEGEGAPQKEEG